MTKDEIVNRLLAPEPLCYYGLDHPERSDLIALYFTSDAATNLITWFSIGFNECKYV